jgi:homoserine dehydrogenase
MTVAVGLIGFGTVGQSVARRLAANRDARARLVRVCGRPGGRTRPHWLPAPVDWTTSFNRLLASDVDVIVELVGGLHPAREWARSALLCGKSVVTANKQLVAEHGPELTSLAARARRDFLFEAAVAGGVPVIRAVQDGLAGDRIVRIAGILNGTCNFILTRMEDEGVAFDEALRDAKARGYAEADPTADVNGLDARAKLAILCGVGFGIRVRPSEISCASIAGLTASDLTRARAAGRAIRQVSMADLVDGKQPRVRASVGPAPVPIDSPLARCRGPQNVVVVTGTYGGEVVLAGQGAGGDPTAVAVVSDIFAIAARRGRAAAVSHYAA